MTSSYVIASLLIGLSLLNWWITPVRPGWIRLLAGAGLFAVLTAAVLDIVGSPLAPRLAAAEFDDQALAAGHPVAAGGCSPRACWSSWSRPRREPRASPARAGCSPICWPALVYLAVLLTIVSVVFGLPVGGLVATSGVIAIVLGLALQNTLADVFAGIAVGIERPYAIGDQVCLDGPVEGEVVQINWRSVQIRTAGNDIATSPTASWPSRASSIAACRRRGRTDAVVGPVRCGGGARRGDRADPSGGPALPADSTMPAPFVALTRLGRRANRYQVAFSVAHSDLLGSAKSDLLQQVLRQFRAAEFGAADPTVAAEPRAAGSHRIGGICWPFRCSTTCRPTRVCTWPSI